MEEKRSTRLVLKTSDLTNGSTTNIGSCDTLRQNFTWFNINLRALLGDLYNQYDYFNLSLISISSSLASANVNAGSTEDRLVYVKLGGLPFVGQNSCHTFEKYCWLKNCCCCSIRSPSI